MAFAGSASAATVIHQLNGGAAIVTPPTWAGGTTDTFNSAQSDTVYYQFTLGSAMTVTDASFTNSSADKFGRFTISSITLYDNLFDGSGTGVVDAQSGGATISNLGSFNFGALKEVVLGPGTYTIAVEGTSGPHSTALSSSFSFAAAVPEPASWALMMVGVGVVGGTLRSRKKTAAAVA